MNIKKIGIVGLGLIGGSFSYAFYDKNFHIYAYDIDQTTLAKAASTNIFEGITDEIDVFLDFPVELIYICLPVIAALDFVKILGNRKIKLPVTDSLSTKVSIVEAAKAYHLNFCGGHPIAGGELSGFDKASKNILKGAKHILVKSENKLFHELKSLHEIIDMNVTPMDAYEHDAVFGLISHIPHLIAFNLMDTVLIENSASLNYTGAGFKDFTRIAGSDPVMWANIFIDNKINIISFAKNFIKNLESWIEVIKKDDMTDLTSKIKDVSDKRRVL